MIVLEVVLIKYTLVAVKGKGVSEETTIYGIAVTNYVTESKFDNEYGCLHYLLDEIMLTTDVMIGGERALVCDYGDVDKDST